MSGWGCGTSFVVPSQPWPPGEGMRVVVDSAGWRVRWELGSQNHPQEMHGSQGVCNKRVSSHRTMLTRASPQLAWIGQQHSSCYWQNHLQFVPGIFQMEVVGGAHGVRPCCLLVVLSVSHCVSLSFSLYVSISLSLGNGRLPWSSRASWFSHFFQFWEQHF